MEDKGNSSLSFVIRYVGLSGKGTVVNPQWHKHWFKDLLAESGNDNVQSRRRAIVAALAFAENYWIRWAEVCLQEAAGRSDACAYIYRKNSTGEPNAPGLKVLGTTDLSELNVTCQMLVKKSKTSFPALTPMGKEDALQQELVKLANWRNNLLHGGANLLPDHVTGYPVPNAPDYTMAALRAIPRDWPLNTMITLVKWLHSLDGSAPESFFTEAVEKLGS